jgi:drug/metabolite transporter superfamily protein YnfA
MFSLALSSLPPSLGGIIIAHTGILIVASLFWRRVLPGFLSNLRTTFRNFAVGIAMMPQLYRQPNSKVNN